LITNTINLILIIVGIDPILSAISQGLDDYSIDLRGDVGSWVRMECIQTVTNAYNMGHFKLILDTKSSENDNVHPDSVELQIAQKLVRLSVEKLDKVRLRACEALFDILSQTTIWSGSKFKRFVTRHHDRCTHSCRS